MLATRDDFAVFFNRNALARQIQQLDQLTQGKRGGKATEFAIDMKFNHKTLLLSGDMSFSRVLDSTLKHPTGHDGTPLPRGRRTVGFNRWKAVGKFRIGYGQTCIDSGRLNRSDFR